MVMLKVGGPASAGTSLQLYGEGSQKRTRNSALPQSLCQGIIAGNLHESSLSVSFCSN